MIVDVLNRFEPDADVLLRAISPHVTDEMLECISQADYGDRAGEHASALRLVRDTSTFPLDMHCVPMEVLALTRWSEPDDPNWKPGRTGESGHWMRAFACAAILRAEHEPCNYHYNEESTDSTVIQLLLSLDALPIDLNQAAAQHFAWLIQHSDPEGKGKFQNESVREYGVALLWSALHLARRAPDADLVELAEWTCKRAEELNWRFTEFSGLKAMVIGCQKRSAWELFGLKLAELDLTDRSTDLQTYVRLIAE
jgi:hypothetical protein